MLPIAAGANIRDQVYLVMEGDAALLALLANQSVASILPRKNVDPAQAKTPFIYVRLEGGWPLETWAFEAHDRPGFGLFKVDRIIDRLQMLFHGRRWRWPGESLERPRRSVWGSPTGELTDQDWNTIKRIGRMQVYRP